MTDARSLAYVQPLFSASVKFDEDTNDPPLQESSTFIAGK